jgi:hypothetical protein
MPFPLFMFGTFSISNRYDTIAAIFSYRDLKQFRKTILFHTLIIIRNLFLIFSRNRDILIGGISHLFLV